MSNLLLSEPILEWLDPSELLTIEQVNKEHQSVIRHHKLSQRLFHVRNDTYRTWITRHRLYQQYPNIETLIFECSHFNHLTSYLRPTIQSLHLMIPLWLHEDFHSQTNLSLINDGAIVGTLDQLHKYLEANPQAQLHQLTISLSPKVGIMFTYYNGTFCGYDRDGPIYEDLDITKDTTGIPPWEFFEVLNSPQKELLQQKLLEVMRKPNWTKRTLPYHFPGAKDIPNAIFTDVYEYEDEIQEFLSEYITWMRETKFWCENDAKN